MDQAAVLALLNTLLPELIARLKDVYGKENPDAPPLTDEQVHAALLNWVATTIAKDDTFLSGEG